MKNLLLITVMLIMSLSYGQKSSDLNNLKLENADLKNKLLDSTQKIDSLNYEIENLKNRETKIVLTPESGKKGKTQEEQYAEMYAQAKEKYDKINKAKLEADISAKTEAIAKLNSLSYEVFQNNISSLASKTLASNGTFIKIKDENASLEDDANCEKPKTLNDLDGGYDVFFSSNKYTLDVDGRIAFISGNSSNSKTNINYKFIQYKKQMCTINGKEVEVMYGCGLDLNLDVKSKKNSANISSLPNIAAAVTYKDADVQYKLKVIGITGDAIRNNLNINGNFDVDNYGKIISKIDEILKNMGSAGVKISPQVIILDK